jgi:hypothetical protein
MRRSILSIKACLVYVIFKVNKTLTQANKNKQTKATHTHTHTQSTQSTQIKCKNENKRTKSNKKQCSSIALEQIQNPPTFQFILQC